MSDPKKLVIDEGDKIDNETMDIASDNETVGKIVDTVVDDALDKSATKKDNKSSLGLLQTLMKLLLVLLMRHFWMRMM